MGVVFFLSSNMKKGHSFPEPSAPPHPNSYSLDGTPIAIVQPVEVVHPQFVDFSNPLHDGSNFREVELSEYSDQTGLLHDKSRYTLLRGGTPIDNGHADAAREAAGVRRSEVACMKIAIEESQCAQMSTGRGVRDASDEVEQVRRSDPKHQGHASFEQNLPDL